MSLVDLVTVSFVEDLTPRMSRVTFTGDGLSEVGTWPDQQLKLLFPPPGRPLVLPAAGGDAMSWYAGYQAIPDSDRPVMRSFTVRSLTGDRLVVDFVLHEHGGPASTWALSARPGDVLGRYGPDPAYRRALDLAADFVLLACDETGLPAVGSLPPLPNATVLVEIGDAAEEQDLPGVRWLHRDGAPHGSTLVAAVESLEVPTTSVFVWLAGEASVVRTLRRDLVSRGVPKSAVDFAGYWRARLTQDDALTEADLAEVRERIADTEAAQSTG